VGYQDQGATCFDVTDGYINGNLEVSGDTVDLATIGTYTVIYSCQNDGGKEATPIVRTVVVYDDVCPTCAVSAGNTITTIEASFPFIDSGATCSDNLSYDPLSVTVTGSVDVEVTGEYIVTYSATDGAGNTNFNRAWDSSSCNPGLHQTRTVEVVDTLHPVISLHDYMHVSDRRLMEEAEQSQSRLSWVMACAAIAGIALVVVRRAPRDEEEQLDALAPSTSGPLLPRTIGSPSQIQPSKCREESI
jgi:hypothetical protein